MTSHEPSKAGSTLLFVHWQAGGGFLNDSTLAQFSSDSKKQQGCGAL